MIHLSVWSHIRRLVVSAMIFGTAVLFMLWLPIRVIKAVLPGFLPYAVAVHTEAPVNELSLELLLLQVGSSYSGAPHNLRCSSYCDCSSA